MQTGERTIPTHETTVFRPDLIPAVRYEDPRAGIAWLERVLGFERHLIVTGGGQILHAELRIGRGFLMCGQVRDDVYDVRTPRACGGTNTQASYIATRDVEPLYANVTSASAEIVRELSRTDYGSLDFSVRDPEGYLWHVGTYHPTPGDPESHAAEALPAEIFGGARYADARGAIAFLEKAFGFEQNFVVPGDGEKIAHAQLSFGSSIFMLGSGRDDLIAMKTPADIGGGVTQFICAYVADVDAHCARAEAAGARVVTRPYDTDYGSREYTARDLEGQLWTFGTYRPSEETLGEIDEPTS